MLLILIIKGYYSKVTDNNLNIVYVMLKPYLYNYNMIIWWLIMGWLVDGFVYLILNIRIVRA